MKKSKHKTKAFIVGDSISIRYHPYLRSLLKNEFDYSRKSNINEVNKNLGDPKAANAGDSSMVLDYLTNLKDKLDVDYLLVNAGLHDIKTDPVTKEIKTPIDQYELNLEKIIHIGRELSRHFIWITTTPINENNHNDLMKKFSRFESDLDEYNNTAKRLMKKLDVPIIDLFKFTVSLGKDLFVDHAHFNEEVVEKQANYISDWIKRFHENLKGTK